jgi:hypothetical protein
MIVAFVPGVVVPLPPDAVVPLLPDIVVVDALVTDIVVVLLIV